MLAQDPTKVTLQLMLHSEETHIRKFIDEHDLHRQAAYYYKTLEGEKLFCLLLGSYRDFDTAGLARETLPPDLKAMKPWRRQFGDVQNDINAYSATP